MFWAYILHCRAGKLYTGHTDDLERRIWQHETGQIPGFTRDFLPVKLVWSEEFVTREEAKKAERQIKGWSRRKKLALIRGDWDAISRYAKSKGSPSTSSGQPVVVPNKVHAGLILEAQNAHPSECCGILTGNGTEVTGLIPAQNVHPTPATHFEVDPQTLINAHRAEREGGPQVIGYYHSHPNGPSYPSETDAQMAAGDNTIWAIVAPGETTWWRDTPDGFLPLPYTQVRG
ncbi:Mov34/MPN/PAD-1 family protein [Aurantiacibacter sp. MUD61]|uniref:Mov34/MPN/PAD-1 family protein n=1 Tax=Aurantiacibacter sp. MUD61 TaxID=3009083 RepID=UPI0022F13CC7|nr:Mov34/MPN/PAD-1 family protein [Aurantiacibacter sp. MUD61]